MPVDVLEYDFTIQPYTQAEQIEIASNCFSLMAINVGAVGSGVATINNFPINPPLAAGTNGEAFVIGGNKGDIIKRKTVDLGFPAGAVGARVIVVQLFYINLK